LDAEIAKSKEIYGRAMFTPEEIKGVPKEEAETVRRSVLSSVRVSWGWLSVLCGMCDSFFDFVLILMQLFLEKYLISDEIRVAFKLRI
jgi:hypothetical protein